MKRFLTLAVLLLTFAGTLQAQSNVSVLVNKNLYDSGEITSSLNTYMNDLRAQGYNPILTANAFANGTALKNYLVNQYQTVGLAGAVAIGNMPSMSFEHGVIGNFGSESFPCDLYFQDMDGVWANTGGYATLDSHTGDVTPEIFFGRIATDKLVGLQPGRTEAGMLNNYFARNHAYRNGQLTVPSNGLAYIDDPWATSSFWQNKLQPSITGALTVVNASATTTAADFSNRMANNQYEQVLLAAHSGTGGHYFSNGTLGAGVVYSADIADIDPHALFFNLYACDATKFTATNFIAGEWVFGTDMGLLAVGSAKSGGMDYYMNVYYNALGEGKTFGEAMQEWWTAVGANGFSSYELAWSYGMTVIGDPLLVGQEFIPVPEPVTLAILALGGTALLRRKPRRRIA